MAEPIGALRVDLSAEAVQFEKDLARARGAVAKTSKKISLNLKKMGKSADTAIDRFVSMRSAAVAAAGVGGLLLFAKNAIEAADNIAKTARSIGITAETLQELRFAASRAGIEVGTFDNAMFAFSKRVGEARNGTGTLITILKNLNPELLAQVQASTSVDQAFTVITTAAANMGNEMDRNALLAAAFGRTAGIEMANLVSDGARGIDGLRRKARELGIVLSNDIVRRSEDAADELGDLSLVFKTAGTALGLEFMPVLRELTRALTDPAVISGARALGSNLSEGLKWVVDNHKPIIAVFGALTGAKLGRIAGLPGMLVGGAAGALTAYSALTTEVDDLNQKLQQQRVVLKQLEADRDTELAKGQGVSPGLESRITNVSDKIFELKMKIVDAERKLQTETKKTTDVVTNQAAISKAKTDAEKAAKEKAAEDAKKLTQELRLQNTQLQQIIGRYKTFPETVDETKQAIELENEARKSNIDLSTKQGRAWAEAYREGQILNQNLSDVESLISETITPLETYNQDVSRLSELFKQGAINSDQFARGIDAARVQLDKAAEDTKAFDGVMDEFKAMTKDAATEAIVNFNSISDVVNSLTEDLFRLAMRKFVVDQVFGVISNAAASAFGGGSSGDLNAQAAADVKSLPFFATGGNFMVGGQPGTDKNLVQFMASRGERVSVQTPAQQQVSNETGGFTFVAPRPEINIFAPPGTEARTEESNGGGRIDVFIDEVVAGNISKPGSKTFRAMKTGFSNVNPALRGR